MKKLMIVTAMLAVTGNAQADCLSKYAKLMDQEKNEEKLYALDRQFVACKKREKQDPNAYVGNSITGAATKDIPGLGSILKNEQLVMTRTESFCNNGKCLATAYITRTSFPKNRPGDIGASAEQWLHGKHQKKARGVGSQVTALPLGFHKETSWSPWTSLIAKTVLSAGSQQASFLRA